MPEWFKKKDRYTSLGPKKEKETASETIWSKCPRCGEIIFQKELERRLKVCPRCNFHFPLSWQERLDVLIDEGTFEQFDVSLTSTDPLSFVANKSYMETLSGAREKTGLKEAAVTGLGRLDGRSIILAIVDFRFVGGSMGSVVGEKITRAVERATAEKVPLLTVSASGGARMQEGMLSLMQMAKTSAALGRFDQIGTPHISILTHPTTGGVTASFATLADIILAEPEALIGFAGPRVIEKTIKQKLPKGFQTSEFMLEHGLVDLVVPRGELKSTVSRLLEFLF